MAMTVVVLIVMFVYNIYIGYILGVIKDVSRNPVMINDTFLLKQNLSPLITGDIISLRLIDSNHHEIYFHNQDIKTLISLSKLYDVKDQGHILYSIQIEMNASKFFIIILIAATSLLLLFYPFFKYEKKESINKSNEILAQLSTKLAHDIRTPISTLNLISSKISDEKIKDLQKSVVHQINLIAEDLLQQNKKQQPIPNSHSNPNLDENYFDFFYNIENEFKIRLGNNKDSIKFSLDERLKEYSSQFLDKNILKILYPIICNAINNSIEATQEENRSIEVMAQIINDDVVTMNDKTIKSLAIKSTKVKTNATSNKLKIQILDNGKGIPAEIVRKIGNEIVSYGKDKNGNGLALYNAQRDIKALNGRMEIASIPNQNTEVQIEVPLPV